MKKGIFLEKGLCPPPHYSICFLKVFYRNKTLHNFPKEGRICSISIIQKILKSLFNRSFYKTTQNVPKKIHKSSEIGEDSKSFICYFFMFFNCSCQRSLLILLMTNQFCAKTLQSSKIL